MGSADYWNDAIDGQVNGVLAKRSPGSTLKPFVYALALDQGVLHPQTIVRDMPTSFGPFAPENFDGRFFGPISAETALIRSRNVPAVWVASQLTLDYDRMREASTTTREDAAAAVESVKTVEQKLAPLLQVQALTTSTIATNSAIRGSARTQPSPEANRIAATTPILLTKSPK